MNVTIVPSQHARQKLPGIKTETDEHGCQSKEDHVKSYDGCFQCHRVDEVGKRASGRTASRYLG